MKIVCFHLNQVGDLAFSLPALKCIRDSFPDAHIAGVARPGLAELLSGTGFVDEVLYREAGLNSGKWRLVRALAARRFDLAAVFSQSGECAMLAYFSRAPRRVGFINTSLGRLLTERVAFNHPPSTANNLRLVEAIGCRITVRDYAGLLRTSQQQADRGDRILSEHSISTEDRIVALAPGTSGRRSVKEWTDEGFAEVAGHAQSLGYRVVVLGTVPGSDIVKENSAIIDLSGKTNLAEAAAILQRCSALVAVDSGILHLAAAAGTRVVGLYGPSNHEITGPQGAGHIVVRAGLDCSPCVKTTCDRGRRCMMDIASDRVNAALDSVLSQPVPPPRGRGSGGG